ncbi:MAG: tRNA 2-thiocytidine biosynthesis protein TtcA [Clostridia bacterium]|nr:tRNA 2-thiocytidine biosynthesis protein TtcA [Clostridia bacterium]
MKRELSETALIEQSIVKKFRGDIYSKFIKAVKEYNLVSEGDKIAVCISGGKDSFLLAKLMQELSRHGDLAGKFDLEFVVMNPGYNETNKKKIEENAEKLGVPIKVFDSNIFQVSYNMDSAHPCYLCARMRRGFLYARAEELGCNKIALGHHKSDVIETTLIGMFFGGQIQGMMPKVRSTNFEGMELIRPMYCISERDIWGWVNFNRLEFINCACRFTEEVKGGANSAREDVKNIIRELRRRNPDVDESIFKSIHNVDLDTLPSFKFRDKGFSFEEKYDDELIIDRKQKNNGD